MEVQVNRLDRMPNNQINEIKKATESVIESGYYILGPKLKSFEENFSNFVGTKYCVGVASGLDALYLAIRALGIGKGDEVLVQSNTYIATVMGITMNGATPIFIEPNEYFNIDSALLEKKISNKTKAIMVVHLYGQATEMDKIVNLCKKYDLKLIEDCAQSHGAKYNGKMTGSFGDIGCFSFYPSKNLGAIGDAGAITTNNEVMANKIKMLRNYGSERRYHNKEIGINSRLDELQAAVLDVKLTFLEEMNNERIKIANRYLKEINNENIILPKTSKGSSNVWHQFVIKCYDRSTLIDYLNAKGVHSIIHYPIPPHLAEAYKNMGFKKGDFPICEEYADIVLSIPMYIGMTYDEQSYVINILNKYKK
ncbi:MAG: DegT/DnrJ/EryC1/StrS family aminotransferase [Erysipelotrichaceae bacterium]